MKKGYSYAAMAILAIMLFACKNMNYDKTKTGLMYKIISGGGKDSVKMGEWMKMEIIQKVDDSVLSTTYGKMPQYIKKAPADPNLKYSPAEVFPMLKKGDSAVTVMLIDSLKKQYPDLPDFMKKGKKVFVTFKVVDVIANDSLQQLDYQKEYSRALPILQKEEQERAAKMEAEMKAQKQKDEDEMEKSGDGAKSVKVVEDFLAAKGIKAEKTGKGTYVVVNTPGTGAQVVNGKFVTVKYDGRFMMTDSSFQANSYTFKLGEGKAIPGWDEGLLLFKEGGKGTLYIPGSRAYGKTPPQGSPFKPMEPLKFNVEVIKVSNTEPAPPQQPASPHN